MTRPEIEAAMTELMQWFARKPYGWRERATPDQLRQWDDRSREYDRLAAVLERMN